MGGIQQQQQLRNGQQQAPGGMRPATRRGVTGNPVANPSEGAQIIGCELYLKLQAFLDSYLIKLVKVC